ncbi:hypothetical protein [Massilia sp. TS11]|uniref:hypothetical protein n=1 Tax=Massilia sp. TS11 TaxID=2908003 RepID=UPI001EDBBFD8|nr:hypothetical protein [Massilia sp. TS11]MCG2583863.1 hypothetical protein [Massilia sp. TS11]
MDPRYRKKLRPRSLTGAVLWGAAAILLCGALFAGARAWQSQQALQIQEAQLDLLKQARKKQAQQRPKPAELEEQRKWTAMQAERDFPWPAVFQAVERSNRKDIELLEFVPEKSTRHLILRGEAQSREAIVSYLEVLAAQPIVETAVLTHEQSSKHDKLMTYSFEIKIKLKA